MIIKGHAPGTILQFQFIRERLRRKSKKPMKFIEVGSGKGFLSHLLLSEGHAGVGVDLNQSACAINQEVNEQHIVNGEYEIINSDFNLIDKTEFDCQKKLCNQNNIHSNNDFHQFSTLKNYN